MTDWLLALVPQYGLWLLMITTFLSCLALPIPASILMLTAGGFAAVDELVLWQVLLAATLGALAGDQTGYWTGRRFGTRALQSTRHHDPARDRLLARATRLMQRQGLIAVFLTRWLFSPLGPWVNLVAGSTHYSALRFTLAGAAGETLWATLYIGAGYAFSGNVVAASDAIGSALGLIGGMAAVLILGAWIWGSLTPSNTD